jgi:hypothetical protein
VLPGDWAAILIKVGSEWLDAQPVTCSDDLDDVVSCYLSDLPFLYFNPACMQEGACPGQTLRCKRWEHARRAMIFPFRCLEEHSSNGTQMRVRMLHDPYRSTAADETIVDPITLSYICRR